jgi:ABC-type branched-subunit amino acid transport system ATPase component
MIVWVNGPFGVGKTTVTKVLVEWMHDAHVFDTEKIGYALRPTLATARPVEDFQDWRPWRILSVAAIVELARYLDGDIVVPQTVLVRDYWTELLDGIRESGQLVRAFTLDVASEEHERRIATDTVDASAAGWRRKRAADFHAAREWLGETSTVIDTTERTPTQVADDILTRL